MNESVKQFISILETKILNINNSISKVSLASSLEEISLLFDAENVWDLTSKDITQLEKNLQGNNKLSTDEISFLHTFVEIPPDLKELKKKLWGLGQEQTKVLEKIQKKISDQKLTIEVYDIEKLEIVLKKYKTLLSKFKQNDMNLITEIDLVSELLENNNISSDVCIDIYQKINQINTKIFEDYGIKANYLEDDENCLSENDLVEKNLAPDLLLELFAEFKIKWAINVDENTTENQANEKQAKLNENLQKLLKYGDYDDYRNKLQFLTKNKLTFIFELPDVLTRILIFTNIKQLVKIIEKTTQNGIDYQMLFRKHPTILYPKLREQNRIIKLPPEDLGEQNSSSSGLMNNYMGNIDFLKENGYPVAEVFHDCPTFARFKTKTVINIHDKLTLYGVSFWNEDKTLKRAFSIFGTLDVLDKLDIGIESSSYCYLYYQNNISRLMETSINFYRIKLAKLSNVKEEEFFHLYENKKSKICLNGKYKQATEFGKNAAETFEMYNAIVPKFEQKELYDSVVDNNTNDVISDISLKDRLIEQLDVLYKSPDSDLIYNLNGVIISRFKVLRYYQTLISSNSLIVPSKDVLLYAITKLSMLNEEEYNTIIDCVNKIKFKARILS